jgi:leucyl-tRNA synthetase
MMEEYNPQRIEEKWQAYWERNKTFKVGRPAGQKFYCLDMFPYPSGSGLHVGHPLGYTATDIYSRYKRMRGFSVLHPMGFDAFGLPAEQHAVNTGEHPAGVTKSNCDLFTHQMKRLGLSYDWDRSLATCDESYYGWTQWIFLKLYNSYFDEKEQRARPIEELTIPEAVVVQGELAIQAYRAEHRLAYYADALVNYCPALGTVLANEEVIDGRSERGGHEVIRKPMKQWMLRIAKYAERLLSELDGVNWPESIKDQQRNWIGKRVGAEIIFPLSDIDASLKAFTTRPDTLRGVTFLVISPEHPLVGTFTTPDRKVAVEEYCAVAARLSELARTMDNRKKTGVFSGSYVINPLTQQKIPLYIGDYVLMNYGTGAVMGVPAHDERDFEFAQLFSLPIVPVIAPPDHVVDRDKVLRGELVYGGDGVMLLSAAEDASALKVEGLPNKEAGERIIAWLQERGHGTRVVQYKLRDWLFSRQRYWGEPIPIIHWEDGRVTAVPEGDLPLVLPEIKEYKPSEGGESPLARAESWLEVVDSKRNVKGRRETNTMPQWAGSCWYYLRFIDPKNADEPWDRELEKRWMPVDLYVGGAEHAVLHLLYARFWHKVLYDLKFVSTKEPFKKLFNQGMIVAEAYKNPCGSLIPTDEVKQKEDGGYIHIKTGDVLEKVIGKMSKSLKNVIDPLEVVKEYGADTLRTYLMFMGPLDATRPWDSKAIMGNARFMKRAWSLVITGLPGAESEPEELTKALHRVIKKVTEETEDLRFNTAIAALMEFINEATGRPITKASLKSFVLLLSPYAPHLAEELWERLGHKQSLAYEDWPVHDEDFLVESRVAVVVQVNGKKRGIVEVERTITEDALREAVVVAMATTEYVVKREDRFITVFQKGDRVPKLVNVIQKV